MAPVSEYETYTAYDLEQEVRLTSRILLGFVATWGVMLVTAFVVAATRGVIG